MRVLLRPERLEEGGEHVAQQPAPQLPPRRRVLRPRRARALRAPAQQQLEEARARVRLLRHEAEQPGLQRRGRLLQVERRHAERGGHPADGGRVGGVVEAELGRREQKGLEQRRGALRTEEAQLQPLGRLQRLVVESGKSSTLGQPEESS